MIRIFGAKAPRDVLKGVIRDLRPVWLLEELGVPFERIALDPTTGENKSPEYLKLNPTGKVPTLVDGDTVLFESAAICEYLAEKYRQFMPLIGTPAHSQFRQWNYWVLTNIDPQFGRIYSADFFLDPGVVSEGVRTMALEILPRFFTPLDERLSRQAHIVDEQMMLPDMHLTCGLYSVRHTSVLNDYPNIRRHYEKCISRPAFQRALSVNGL